MSGGSVLGAVGSLGGGKGGGGIDTGPSAASFQAAADVIEKQFPVALKYYQQNLGQGVRQATDQFLKGELESTPFSDTAKESMNELRSFLGIEPLSKTAGMVARIDNTLNKFKTPGLTVRNSLSNALEGVRDQLSLAEQESDPSKRAELQQSINQELRDIKYGIEQDQRLGYNASSGVVNNDSKVVDKDAKYYNTTGIVPLVESGAYKYGETDPELAQQVNFNIDFLEEITGDLDQIESEFSQYEVDKPEALTGEQIQEKLEDLPEYQFQFNQGQKALDRSQAARGVLQSGRGAIEAVEFGQNLAQNVYAGHLSRLSGLAGLNLPVTQQNIGNIQNQGGFLANTFQANGLAQQQSIQDVAKARQSAFNNVGKMQFQAAQADAQAQAASSASLGKGLGKLFGGGGGGGGGGFGGFF